MHFHCPKPRKGLEIIAKCNVTALPHLREDLRRAYAPHINQGICCDYGRTAEWSMKVVNTFSASLDDLCDNIDNHGKHTTSTSA